TDCRGRPPPAGDRFRWSCRPCAVPLVLNCAATAVGDSLGLECGSAGPVPFLAAPRGPPATLAAIGGCLSMSVRPQVTIFAGIRTVPLRRHDACFGSGVRKSLLTRPTILKHRIVILLHRREMCGWAQSNSL